MIKVFDYKDKENVYQSSSANFTIENAIQFSELMKNSEVHEGSAAYNSDRELESSKSPQTSK